MASAKEILDEFAELVEGDEEAEEFLNRGNKKQKRIKKGKVFDDDEPAGERRMKRVPFEIKNRKSAFKDNKKLHKNDIAFDKKVHSDSYIEEKDERLETLGRREGDKVLEKDCAKCKKTFKVLASISPGKMRYVCDACISNSRQLEDDD